jgi:DNA-binding LytR/AlgR family response regulator
MSAGNTRQINVSEESLILLSTKDKQLSRQIKNKLYRKIGSLITLREYPGIDAIQQDLESQRHAKIIFVDINESSEEALAGLKKLKKHLSSQTLIIIFSRQINESLFRESLHLGVFDVIGLPLSGKPWAECWRRIETKGFSTKKEVLDETQLQSTKRGTSPNVRLMVRLLKREIRLVALQEIAYIEAYGSLSVIYQSNGERIISAAPFSQYIQMTAPYGQMVRVHRKYIVNTIYIDRYNTQNRSIQFSIPVGPVACSRRLTGNLRVVLGNE